MSNKKYDSKNSIKNKMKTNVNTSQNANEQLNISENEYNEAQFDTDYQQNDEIKEEARKINEKIKRKLRDKPLKIFGTICIIVSMILIIFSSTKTVDTSTSAKDALKNGVSTDVSVGTILLSEDENVEGNDYTIIHKSDVEDTKIWVWDYAGEDGDYVQILVNGAPIGDAFMILNKVKELTVPAVGKVEVKGVRDGGGGITYAIAYEINEKIYFNGTSEGELNTYTLINE